MCVFSFCIQLYARANHRRAPFVLLKKRLLYEEKKHAQCTPQHKTILSSITWCGLCGVYHVNLFICVQTLYALPLAGSIRAQDNDCIENFTCTNCEDIRGEIDVTVRTSQMHFYYLLFRQGCVRVQKEEYACVYGYLHSHVRNHILYTHKPPVKHRWFESVQYVRVFWLLLAVEWGEKTSLPLLESCEWSPPSRFH